MTFWRINSSLLGYSSTAVILGMLGLFNLALIRIPVDISPTSIPKGKETVPSAERAPGVQPADVGLNLQDTLSRPVFSPTRREFEPVTVPVTPQPETVTPAPPAVVEIPAFHLEGIRTIGADVSALLSIGAEDQPRWLPIGGALEGWTLERIDTHSVALRSRDQLTVVDLYSRENPDVPQN